MRALHACAAIGFFAVTYASLLRLAFAAPAAIGRVELAWNAPGDCPSTDAVVADMNRILGGPPSRDAKVTVDVRQVALHRWSEHLSTDVDGLAGERDLEADSCESLAAATALILAWTIDPQRAAGALLPPPDASSPAGPVPAPAPEPVDPVPASPSPSAPPPFLFGPPPPAPQRARAPNTAALRAEPKRHLRAVLAVDAVGDLGMQPQADVAGRVTVGLLLGRARIEASVADWLSEEAHARAPLGNEGTTLHPLEGGLRACLRWEPARRWELDPCLGGGFVRVTSHGFNETVAIYAAETTWADVYADAMGVWTLAVPLALRASLGLAVPITRPAFDIAEPAGQSPLLLHRPAAIAGRVALGVEVRFP